MAYKYRLVTSWPVSVFWALLSTVLAIVATYSFLQVDWVIKRNVMITTFYRKGNEPLRPDQIARALPPDPTNETVRASFDGDLEDFYFTEEVVKPAAVTSHASHLVRVTRVVVSLRFGVLGLCTHLRQSNGHCQLYGKEHSISLIWTMVNLIGGSGCVILCLTAVLSLLAVALPSSKMRYQVATMIGHGQTVAVVLLFSSLLLFPMGFDSDFVRAHCGASAGFYTLSDCEVGWAYALVLVCASLALYCPVLVRFTAEIVQEILPKYL